MLPGLLFLALGLAPMAHPLHSSSASLNDAGGGRITLSVRIFSDDLAAVAPGGDSAVAAYVRQHVRIIARNGGAVVLEITSIAIDGDLTRITARGTVAGGLAGLRVQQAVLWERYRDQVNLVRASIGGRSVTMVFAHGDPPREV
jgi:hypothetical protein